MSTLFFRNPRLTVLVISLILVSGLSSFMLLPRMEDPLLTERFALINTRLPSADAERVEALVTEKIEEELEEIDEIKELRSVSRAGVSTITVELRDDVYEVDSVWSRVRDKIEEAAVLLPEGASDPEFERQEVKAYALIVALRWSDQLPVPGNAILRRLAIQLEDEIKAVTGTEQVDTFGDPNEEYLVEIDPAELAAMGLTVTDIARQLAASDSKVSAGQLRSKSDLLIEIDGELDSLRRIASTPIQYGNDGRFVMLGDIANIKRSIVEPPSSLAIIQGQPAIAIGAMVRPNARVDHWTDTVSQVLEAFEGSLPRGIELSTVFLQNKYVETRLAELLMNLLLGGLAVAAVILLMMGWRSAMIVCSALPLSALMVLSGMRFLDIPIHQMSVTGLIIALGLLIDNAIVIVDEVSDRLRRGFEAGEAVRQSVGHLAVPLFGSTLTTALAFGPIALMPGPAGEFVGSIAVSVILAIFSSFLLAMTIVPALSAWSFQIRPKGDRRRERLFSDGFSHPAMTRIYRRTLEGIFERPSFGLVLGMLLPVLGFVQFRLLPEQFFPPAERDQFQIEVEMPSQSSIATTLDTVKEMREHLLADEEVESVSWFIGESAPSFYYNIVQRRRNTAHYAQALVQLKPGGDSQPIIDRLQQELDDRFRESRILVRQLEQGPPFDAPIEVRLYGPDQDVLRELGNQVRVAMSRVSTVIHTRSDLSEGVPKLSLQVDEEAARLAGLDHLAIARQIDAMTEGAIGGTVLEETEELPVRVRTADSDRRQLVNIASLDLVPVTSKLPEERVPLSAVAKITLVPESSAIPRFNGKRMNEVQAYLKAGTLPATALAEFEERMNDAGFDLPPGYTFEFGGEAAKRDDAIGNLMANVGVLLVLMAATLVLSFNSFRLASIVGAVAVLSAGLAFGALWIFGYPFGFMAIVGTMGLMGVAVNDAIVVLAAIREDEAARTGDPSAIRDIVVRSSRHVIATSLTTIAGFIPLLMGGGGFWPPLAVSIAGGVCGATILALYFAPSAYLVLMCFDRSANTACQRERTEDTSSKNSTLIVIPA